MCVKQTFIKKFQRLFPLIGLAFSDTRIHPVNLACVRASPLS